MIYNLLYNDLYRIVRCIMTNMAAVTINAITVPHIDGPGVVFAPDDWDMAGDGEEKCQIATTVPCSAST